MDELEVETAELIQTELAFEAEKLAKEAEWQRNQNRLELALAKLQLEESKIDQLNSKIIEITSEVDQMNIVSGTQQLQLENLETFEAHLTQFANKMGYSHPMDVINIFSYYKSATAEAQRHFAANLSQLQQLTSAFLNEAETADISETIKKIETKTQELL